MFYLTVLLLLSCLLDSDVLFLEIKQFIFAGSRYVGGFNADFHKIRHRFAHYCAYPCHVCVICDFYIAQCVAEFYRITLLSLRGAKFLLISGANGDGMVRAFCGQPFTQAQHLMQRSASVLHSLPRAMA